MHISRQSHVDLLRQRDPIPVLVTFLDDAFQRECGLTLALCTLVLGRDGVAQLGGPGQEVVGGLVSALDLRGGGGGGDVGVVS